MGEKEALTIALIGAGRTGTPLLEDLLQYSYIQVLGVADQDASSPGMQLAKAKQISCYQEPMQLVHDVGEVDILVEVSGDKTLKGTIKEHYEQTENRTTLIVHDLLARLMISLSDRSDHLVPSYHPDDKGIG